MLTLSTVSLVVNTNKYTKIIFRNNHVRRYARGIDATFFETSAGVFENDPPSPNLMTTNKQTFPFTAPTIRPPLELTLSHSRAHADTISKSILPVALACE